MEVVFCANFFWKWGKYPPFQSLWSGSFYALSGNFEFQMGDQTVKDEEQDIFEKKWKNKMDSKKCREASPGTTFCHMLSVRCS